MESVTQDRILRSAAECFGRWGYKKTSVDAVAERAGVAKGTVYLYCESKEDLFYQSVLLELRSWVAELSKKIDPRRPAKALLLEMATADLSFVESRPLVRDLLFGLFHGLLPDWADKFEELRALGQKHVVEVLELGIRQGAFAPDLDVVATARVLQTMQIAGTLLGHRTKKDLADVRREQIAAVRLVLKGLEVR
ncbi:MAG TPA: TetR/AcrR family transcriptional regulator [Polyangiaceae bacterium]|nr:TetR/AcrR family transcriptional regulator [Polyangiaceae bacterium]